MDDLIRTVLASPGAWGGKADAEVIRPPDLRIDLTAAVVALLVERAGGRVALEAEEIREVASRLLLLPHQTEDRGIILEVRSLAQPEPS